MFSYYCCFVDEPGTYCHGSVREGQFEGRILIPQSQESYSVEPSSRYLEDADFHSIIYKDEDVVLPDEPKMEGEGEGSCGVKGEIKKRMDKKLKNLRVSIIVFLVDVSYLIDLYFYI